MFSVNLSLICLIIRFTHTHGDELRNRDFLLSLCDCVEKHVFQCREKTRSFFIMNMPVGKSYNSYCVTNLELITNQLNIIIGRQNYVLC